MAAICLHGEPDIPTVDWQGGVDVLFLDVPGAVLSLESHQAKVVVSHVHGVRYEQEQKNKIAKGHVVVSINGEPVGKNLVRANELISQVKHSGGAAYIQWCKPDGSEQIESESHTKFLQDDVFLKYPKVHFDECLLINLQGVVNGVDCMISLTSHRILFHLDPAGIVPLLSVLKLVQKDDGSILIVCKDIREIRVETSDKFLKTLKVLTTNDPFKRTLTSDDDDRAGWGVYDPLVEYTRIGLPKFLRVYIQQDHFNLCGSYPRVIVVPSGVPDADVVASSKFRSKSRLPVVSWVHPQSKAVLARCAQPLRGVSNAVCQADERLVRAIMNVTNPMEVPIPSQTGFSNFFSSDPEPLRKLQTCAPGEYEPTRNYVIMDARSQIASMGNQVLGKGTENPINYPGSILVFLSIDNIHVVRNCFNKIFEIASREYSAACLYRSISDCGWLKQIVSVLTASITVVKALEDNGLSVLTHCSDGWDRTAQMCSMAMLLMDPYYRTLDGFAVLIEKEWCAFGHKFRDRCGNCTHIDEQEYSPIFVLWIDCVWQVMNQFPAAFEFNDLFLVSLLDEVTSGYSSTFLFNSFKAREKHKATQVSVSVWSILFQKRNLFSNGSFQPSRCTIVPKVSPKYIRFWDRYYLRHDESNQSQK